MNTTKEHRPRYQNIEGQLQSQYWFNGSNLYWNSYPVNGADLKSFVFYLGSFAKDKNNCYIQNSKIRDANPLTFKALNYAYAKDDKSVWVLTGKIKDVDPETFEVCDDGIKDLGNGLYAPYGYAKDRINVYYFNYQGKAKLVKKANPELFSSFNDSYFGKPESVRDFSFYSKR